MEKSRSSEILFVEGKGRCSWRDGSTSDAAKTWTKAIVMLLTGSSVSHVR
jgi:hypothetical protein